MMLTPCGPRAVPTGGAGVAAPAWSCTLTSAAIFFLGGIPLSLPSCGRCGAYVPATSVLPAPRRVLALRAFRAERLDRLDLGLESLTASSASSSWSDLLNLTEAQLDRGLPAEDLDQRLDALGLRVDLGDRGVERGERAVDHHHRVGDVEVGHLDRLLGRRRGPGRGGAGGDRLGLGAGHH